MGEEPLVRFDLPQPESFWDEFLVDLAIKFAPWRASSLDSPRWPGLERLPPWALDSFSRPWAMMLKLRFSYTTKHFPEMSVATLLRQVKVSGVRPVPCRSKAASAARGPGPGLVR